MFGLLTSLLMAVFLGAMAAAAGEQVEITSPPDGTLLEEDDYGVGTLLTGLDVGVEYQLLLNGLPAGPSFVASTDRGEMAALGRMYPTWCGGAGYPCSCTQISCLPEGWAFPEQIDISRVFRAALVQLVRSPGLHGEVVAQDKVVLRDTRWYDALSEGTVSMVSAADPVSSSVAIDLTPSGLDAIAQTYLVELVPIDEVNTTLADLLDADVRAEHDAGEDHCVKYVDIEDDLPDDSVIHREFESMMRNARMLQALNTAKAVPCLGSVTCEEFYGRSITTESGVFWIPTFFVSRGQVKICAQRFEGRLEEVAVSEVDSIEVEPKFDSLESETVLGDVDSAVTIFVNEARLTYAMGKYEDDDYESLPDIDDRGIEDDTIECPWQPYTAVQATSDRVRTPVEPAYADAELDEVDQRDRMGFELRDPHFELSDPICADHDWRDPIDSLGPQITATIEDLLDDTWEEKGPFDTYLSGTLDDALSSLELGRSDDAEDADHGFVDAWITLDSVTERPASSVVPGSTGSTGSPGIRVIASSQILLGTPHGDVGDEFWLIDNQDFPTFGDRTPDVYPMGTGIGDNPFDIAVTHSTGFFNQMLHALSETSLMHPSVDGATWGDLDMCVSTIATETCSLSGLTCSCTGGAPHEPLTDEAVLTGEALSQFVTEFQEMPDDTFAVRMRPTLAPIMTLELQPIDRGAWPITLNLGQYLVEFIRLSGPGGEPGEVVLTWAFDYYDSKLSTDWGEMNGRIDAHAGMAKSFGTIVDHAFSTLPDTSEVASLAGVWIEKFVVPALMDAVNEMPSVEFDDVVGLDREPFEIVAPDGSWSRIGENVTMFGLLKVSE